MSGLIFGIVQNLKTTCLISVSVTLKRVDSLAFLNIHLTLKLLGNLRITNCECEWSFPSLENVNGS